MIQPQERYFRKCWKVEGECRHFFIIKELDKVIHRSELYSVLHMFAIEENPRQTVGRHCRAEEPYWAPWSEKDGERQ